MSDIKLFRIQSGKAEEIKGQASDLEKPLQTLIENNLEALLGVRFLATEYTTGKTHGGRIDSLGLDENYSPVILEYKRSLNENVINQGLYYLDWLMDHKAEYWKLVVETLGKEMADKIDWTGPRLLCIASDFTKYDEHAVQQINRNIELLRYRKFGSELLLFELVNSVTSSSSNSGKPSNTPNKQANTQPSELVSGESEHAKALAKASQEVQTMHETLKDYIVALGDDVQVNELKQYLAYKRLRNFATVVIKNKNELELNLHLDPDSTDIDSSWMRDGRKQGHWGTGDLQLFLRKGDDLDKAKPLIRRAYDGG